MFLMIIVMVCVYIAFCWYQRSTGEMLARLIEERDPHFKEVWAISSIEARKHCEKLVGTARLREALK